MHFFPVGHFHLLGFLDFANDYYLSSASCKGGMSYSYYGDFVDFTGPQPKSLICGERNSTNENGITPPKN